MRFHCPECGTLWDYDMVDRTPDKYEDRICPVCETSTGVRMSTRAADKKTWRVLGREFLNSPSMDYHGQAYAITRVENTDFPRATPTTIPSLHFQISDCTNIITLMWNMRTLADIENSRFKIRALKRVIDDFAEALEAEMDLRETRISKKAARKKAEVLSAAA